MSYVLQSETHFYSLARTHSGSVLKDWTRDQSEALQFVRLCDAEAFKLSVLRNGEGRFGETIRVVQLS